jgi:magnesium-dependent phosphatase-1
MTPTKLVAFDGDDTLWIPRSGLFLSDRTPTDSEGRLDFRFEATEEPKLTIRRDDGALFQLRLEVPAVLRELRERGLLVGVISYNHATNVRTALQAFGLVHLVDYVRGEWHANKDLMLLSMLEEARQDGHDITPAEALLVDDDPRGAYRVQCSTLGARFLQFGDEIKDLREVLTLL